MVTQDTLAGKRILVVEDDYYIVTELSAQLESMAAVVAGAAPGVEEALELIASARDLDGVILDINLGGEMSFPVADELERLGLPFVFATAYNPDVVPARHADKIVLRKPFDEEGLAVGLSAAAHPRAVSTAQAAQNKILGSLPTSVVDELLPLLRVIRMPRGALLEIANQTISRVYFPVDCIASLVAVGAAGTRIETGLIGNEGMTGTGIALGDNRTPHELINQIEGDTLVMAAGDFEDALAAFPELHLLAGRFARSLGIQVSHTALANGKFDVRTRLARWLLMVDDRSATSAFGLTHEYLSIMLGARRSSVTEAIHVLEGEHLVRSTRSHLEIRDRSRLLAFAGESYGIPEAEHHRLMSLPLSSRKAGNRSAALA